jgi:short-subunit dehydrogenase
MARPLNEQVVVITGASSGIGRETAMRFAQKGATVVIAARNQLALEQVRDDIRSMGGEVHIVVTDVADPEQVEALAAEAFNFYGRIDTWVNDASVALYGTVAQTSVEEIDQVIRVNLMGVVHGVKAVLPYMRRQGYGTIINVGSVISWVAMPLQAAYSAAKQGVKGFTDALRLELQHEQANINVTLVMPAGINTPFFNHARSKLGVKPMPIPPVYRPEMVADAIITAAEKYRRDVYAGGASWMFVMLERLSPALMDRILLAGDMGFRLQKTNEIDDGRDNLYEPNTETGRIHGDFAELAKPSLFTRVMEIIPSLPVVLVSMLAGVVTLSRLRRQPARRGIFG